ncbi:LicD family protein [Streptococcus lutetiensis]|jgi:lipopolysaccharide cholinephosphotransferase|uniref:LicD family protein n=1 Tax=Streptococcus lutetiensis TaxID=150055 RepID=UPI000FE204E2|nr:LicD family protein [Streptococcus lutetiensis]RHB86906.1 LicD family protein [Streptococcus lutetiensis]
MGINNEIDKIHELDLVISEELKRICEKHDIKYFMIAGTLLGAVRHKGFIPWDDDMDFGMLREDFDKFISVCNHELDKDKFYLETMEGSKNYPYNFAKIRLKNTKIIEEFSKDSLTEEKGIFIDIFPMDFVSSKKLKRAFQFKIFWLARNLLLIKLNYASEHKKKKLSFKLLKFLLFLLPVKFLKNIKKKSIEIANNEDVSTVRKVVTSDGAYGLKRETLEKKWIDVIIQYPFEDTFYPGIAKYDDYLSYFYGDYMKLPPKNERNQHKRIKVDFGPYAN